MPANPSTSLGDSVLQTNCPQTEAIFRRTGNGYARIYFLKSSMSDFVIDTFFQHGHFRIDYAFDLPAVMVNHLQLLEPSIQPGLYKAREYKFFFIIDFEPSKKSRGSSYAQD